MALHSSMGIRVCGCLLLSRGLPAVSERAVMRRQGTRVRAALRPWSLPHLPAAPPPQLFRLAFLSTWVA
jgi:hypothetical protein